MNRMRSTVSHLSFLLILAGCATGSPRGLQVKRVDAPPSAFLKDTIAYRAEGAARRYQKVLLPFREIAADNRVALFAYADGRYWIVPSQIERNGLIANVTPGVTYVIAKRPAPALARALGILCFVEGIGRERGDRRFVPKICTQILCGSQFVPEHQLKADYGLPAGVAPGGVGGWNVIPQDLCAECTRPGTFAGGELTLPTIECASVGSDLCATGTPLLSATFEADATGSAPAASPAGAPADDSIASTGNVTIVNAATGSKAARLIRGSLPTGLDAILGAGASSTASYCVGFRTAIENGATPMRVALVDSSARLGYEFVIGGSSLRIESGGAPIILSAPPAGTAVQLRIELNAGAGIANFFIDGSAVATGLPLIDADFGIPARVTFSIIPMIVEGFPGAYIVDDISVRRN